MKSDTTGQLALSIGVLLSSERESKGIPVEKAAKETRMRAQRIRDMENDDLSSFSNPSYARMFIIAYAKYLGVPLKKVRELLPDSGQVAVEGYAYTRYAESDLPPLRPNIVNRPKRSPLLPTLIGVAVLVVLVALGVFIYALTINVIRLREDQDKPQPPPAATEPLKSAEEVLAETTRTEFEVRGLPLAANVSPTPANNPLTPTLDAPITILPSEAPRQEDLADEQPSTLEQSIPAPAADPIAPAIPISDPIEAADRAFLLQTTE